MSFNMPVVTKTPFVMPKAPAIVLWRNAPGATPSYAVVTAYGRHAISVAVCVPDSRIVVPKDGVRFVLDPWNQANGINADSGVWDYTDETKVVRILARAITSQSGLKMLPDEDLAIFLDRFLDK